MDAKQHLKVYIGMSGIQLIKKGQFYQLYAYGLTHMCPPFDFQMEIDRGKVTEQKKNETGEIPLFVRFLLPPRL